MALANQLLNPKQDLHACLENNIVCIILMYNVDGALVRGSHSRANQLGPVEYGFRGNALNLDLNRDFIKCDSQNALAFNSLFTRMMPHVLIDTHVSNGADYQHTLTLITTQSDKLGLAQGRYIREVFEPALFHAMDKTAYPMVPYVHTMGRTPESGIEGFLETPRFATGYAALYGAIGLTTETHMLKPFAQRVKATHTFLEQFLLYTAANKKDILWQYEEGREERMNASTFPLGFALDTTRHRSSPFNGFEAITEPSELGQGERLRYNRKAPWQGKVAYYDRYLPTLETSVPHAYILPKAWSKVLERLDSNQVEYHRLKHDTTLLLKVSFADQFETSRSAYEGHYFHYKIHCRDTTILVHLSAGDIWIPTQQVARRYLVETLESNGNDSFFAWNFFDSMLQQKEWFSDYVFEDIAADLLQKDHVLKAQFEKALATDSELASDHWQQLYWIYKRSPYYEPTAFRIPVFRLMEP
jgi:hypothetical protein